jgi:hypothetical protein
LSRVGWYWIEQNATRYCLLATETSAFVVDDAFSQAPAIDPCSASCLAGFDALIADVDVALIARDLATAVATGTRTVGRINAGLTAEGAVLVSPEWSADTCTAEAVGDIVAGEVGAVADVRVTVAGIAEALQLPALICAGLTEVGWILAGTALGASDAGGDSLDHAAEAAASLRIADARISVAPVARRAGVDRT